MSFFPKKYFKNEKARKNEENVRERVLFLNEKRER